MANNMKNTLIKTDGTEQELPSGQLTLEQMYQAIGCDIVERVSLSETESLWCDENGLLHEKPIVNLKATLMYQNAVGSREVGIVGNAILSTGEESPE